MQRRASGRVGYCVVGIALSVLSVGCDEGSPIDPGSAFEPSFAKPVPSTPLRITIQDAGNRIQSDGQGAYVDGQETVIAEIDGPGNLQFRVVKTASPARTLVVDFAAQLSGDPYRPPATSQTGFAVLTNKTNNSNPGIGQLTVGGSGCYNTTIAYFDATTTYRTTFNTVALPGSTYVRISRTSETTWTMATDDTCGSTPHAGGLSTQLDSSKKPQPAVFRGYYDLQFSFLLEAL